MHKLSLKLQIWLGFGLMLTLTAIVAFISILNLNGVGSQANTIVSEAQPTMLDALSIQADMNESARIINAFIITQNNSDRNEMKQAIKNLTSEIELFMQRENIINNKEIFTSVKNIQNSIKQYQTLTNKIEHLVDNPSENYPALEISSSKMNPLNKTVLTSLENALLSELEEDSNQERKLLFADFSELRHNWMNITTSNRTFLANPSDTRNSQTQLYRDKHFNLLKAIQNKSNMLTFEQEEAIDSINTATKTHFKLLDKIYAIYKSGDWRIDQSMLTNEIQPLIKNISQQLNDIVSVQQNNSETLSDNLLSKIKNSLTISFIVVTAAFLIGIGIAWSSIKQISNIVDEVSESLSLLSRGEFNIKLNENRAGETGKIAATVNAFSIQLQKMINNLVNSVSNLHSASDKMSTIVADTSNNILQQHRETEMVATAVEQMSATAQEVASGAATAASSAKQAKDLASSGALFSTEALGGINHLVNDLQKASDVIQNLRNESNNISVVLDVIRDISEQTNLLALNAAIEAARAGEQGRGFAVVADEVRTLASRTQESTDQIRVKIEQLQNGANDAVSAMDSAITEANLNNDQVEKVTEALANISGEINHINNQLDQMAAASEQQSATSLEISRNVISISTLAENSAQGTEHAKAAEDELSTATQNIQNVITNFKT